MFLYRISHGFILFPQLKPDKLLKYSFESHSEIIYEMNNNILFSKAKTIKTNIIFNNII